MADEVKDMEYSDIRAALSGAPTEKAPATEPAAEPVAEEKVVETPPTDSEAPEGEAPPAPPAEDEGRKKRFSQLTKERNAERAARVALEARLAALEASQAGKSQAAPVESDGRPVKPDIDKYVGDSSWADYSKALERYEEQITDWKVNQALAKKEQERELVRRKADYDRVQSGWQKQVDDLTDDNDDLEDAIKTVGDSVAKKGIIDVIKESEVGGKMVLYLHRNPDELKKVEGMSIASAARYLGKIEARIEGEVAAPVTKATKALPKPPAQLGGNPQGSAKGFDYQKASDEDFKAQLVREGLFKPRR